jgi:hypothetical protein
MCGSSLHSTTYKSLVVDALLNGDIEFEDVFGCEMVWRIGSFKAWEMGKVKAWAKRIT